MTQNPKSIICNSRFKIHNSSQSGTTLIEVLIYITILGFIITTTLAATYQILSGSQSLDYKNITEEEAGFIIAKINWSLNDISTICSPFAPNTSDNALSVDDDPACTSPVIFALDNINHDITIKKTGSALLLNSDRVTITDLKFEHIQKTGILTADSIKTSFKANDKYFETTKFIR